MIPSACLIRPAAMADARAIAEMYVRSWQATYRGVVPDAVLDGLSVDERERCLLDALRARTRHDLVLEEAGRIAGWTAFGPARDPDLDSKKFFELYSLYLHPSACGRGRGRSLYRAAEERMQQAGEQVVLWVLQGNVRARDFYESAGFVLEPDRIQEIDFGEARVSEVRYRKRWNGSRGERFVPGE